MSKKNGYIRPSTVKFNYLKYKIILIAYGPWQYLRIDIMDKNSGINLPPRFIPTDISANITHQNSMLFIK